MNTKEMNMKLSTIAKNFTIAAGIALGLCIAPTAKAEVQGCSNATLKGTFSYKMTGALLIPGLEGPFAEVGVQTFDGNGGTTATATLSQNGNIYQVTITGKYTVNPNCTGTFTLQVAPFGVTNLLFFVLDDGGNGFQSLEINPAPGGKGSVVTGSGRRQFPVGDLRNN